MKEFETLALTDNLPEVLAFVDEQLESAGCPMKVQMQIDIAVEEIFVNISHYAYGDGSGTAKLRFENTGSGAAITFIDSGVPYDPLAKADPDITLSAEEREIGGLGIFMVKKTMDDVSYKYIDGHNILTLKKGW